MSRFDRCRWNPVQSRTRLRPIPFAPLRTAHALPPPCLWRRSARHAPRHVAAAWLARSLDCDARLRTLLLLNEVRVGVHMTRIRAVCVRVVCSHGQRAPPVLTSPESDCGGHARVPPTHASTGGTTCLFHALLPGVGQRAAPARVGLLRRGALDPGPNPNPRLAARLPAALQHAALRSCTRQRSISGARARLPPSSPRHTGRCAAVSDCTPLITGNGAAAPARIGCAASLHGHTSRCFALSPRAATHARRGSSAPRATANPCARACSCCADARFAAFAFRRRSLRTPGTLVRSTWFEGRRST